MDLGIFIRRQDFTTIPCGAIILYTGYFQLMHLIKKGPGVGFNDWSGNLELCHLYPLINGQLLANNAIHPDAI